MLTYLILVAISGLIVGGLARLALPGPDPMSIWMTMAIGIAGSFIGGLLVYAITGGRHAGGFAAHERGGADGVAQHVPRRLAPSVVGDQALVVDRVLVDALEQRAAVPVRLYRELAQRPVDRAAQRRVVGDGAEHAARVGRL